jgi:hypothetical protein
VPEPKTPADGRPAEPTEVEKLLARAHAGDASTLPMLRKLLESGPLTEAAGNLATQVEYTLVGNAAGKDLVFKEATHRKLARMRAELAGENPTPLERLLAERVALCWLALHDVEVRFAQAKDLSIKQATYWQERIDRSHRRYLSAIKTLATVRKLALPVLQVNIAKRQVNIAGPAPDAAEKK